MVVSQPLMALILSAACGEHGVHKPSVAGIHGGEKDNGAFSIALTGGQGYEDDVDMGYTM
jgi:hypothetical protein